MKQILTFVFLVMFTCSFGQQLPEMITVGGGPFRMGTDKGEKDEAPAHQVTITSFKMARTETTVLQWQTFCQATSRRMPEAPWFGLKSENPIVNVSWDDAVAYCVWLSEKTGKKYRLPTEAEWEYAARGGSRSMGYSFSGAKTPDTVAWYGGKSDGTMPVAQKLPNELGLYDMTGNVWEWCADWYDAKYYALSSKTNPLGASTGKFYTLRGGAWDIGQKNCRVEYRNPLAPTSRNHNKGFRVVEQI